MHLFSFLFLLPHRSRLFLDLFSSFAFTDTCHFERSRSRILHSPFCIVCIACISCIACFAAIVCIACIYIAGNAASLASVVSLAEVASSVRITFSHHLFAYLRVMFRTSCISSHTFANLCMAPPILTCKS